MFLLHVMSLKYHVKYHKPEWQNGNTNLIEMSQLFQKYSDRNWYWPASILSTFSIYSICTTVVCICIYTVCDKLDSIRRLVARYNLSTQLETHV